jgi:hypothetical protein
MASADGATIVDANIAERDDDIGRSLDIACCAVVRIAGISMGSTIEALNRECGCLLVGCDDDDDDDDDDVVVVVDDRIWNPRDS